MMTRFAALFALGLSGSAWAQPVQDAVTGLSATPPPGYQASAMPANGPNTARFSIRRPQDEAQTGCQVAFAPAPQNAQLTQEQINDAMARPEWLANARNAISSLYDITASGTVERPGPRAVTMVGDLKHEPRLPPEAYLIRTYFGIMETPRGRTSVVCVASKAEFAARQADFDAVLRGVTAP